MRSLVLLFFLMPEIALAEFISINCGASSGYAHYFEGGFVSKKNAGFTEDKIPSGQISLTFDTEKRDGDILTKDATGVLKSASSQGAMVSVIPASNKGFNWFAVYEDGTLEIYSYNIQSNKVASYRNTVGNSQVAKNSLMIASCNE